MLPSIRHALRVLRKDPVFTTVAIASLALGIGATSAMYTFADALLLRPLPIRDPDRVVALKMKTAEPAPIASSQNFSYPDYIDLRDHNRTFEGMVACSNATFGFSPKAGTLPRMKFGLFVSGNFLRVFGVEPPVGRGFRADEDQVEGRDAVVVRSRHQREFQRARQASLARSSSSFAKAKSHSWRRRDLSLTSNS
jgi:hypothetical protein